jgi:hypothetical protein
MKTKHIQVFTKDDDTFCEIDAELVSIKYDIPQIVKITDKDEYNNITTHYFPLSRIRMIRIFE